MEKILESLLSAIILQHDTVLYAFLFISAVFENVFPPVPGDTVTAFGAFLVGSGRLNYFLVYLSTTFGSVVGFLLLFLAGKFMGREFFIKKNYKYFSAKQIISAELWFQKWGQYLVLANRFFPGIRSVIAIVAGISNLGTLKVFWLSTISASIWNLIWIHTGFMLGSNWDIVKEKLNDILMRYNYIAGSIIAVIVILLAVYLYRNRRKTDV
jgi:membrane protein DedA with SNARE-associated domain